MPRVPYVYLQMPIDWNWLVMPIIVYVCIHLWRGYFKARGDKKDSIPDMIKVELTNIPLKSGIASFMVLVRPWSSLPRMLKLSGVELCPVCWMCTWMGEGCFRCSLYLSPKVLDVSSMYPSLQAVSPHW